jgi:hypothetical protein
MYSQGFPQVACQLGGEQILLPYQNLKEISVPRYYWPNNREQLVLVCREHGHTSVYSNKELRWGPLPPSDHNQTLTNFWKAEFRCDRQNCGKIVLAHTRLGIEHTSESVAKFLLESRPGLKCANNHVLPVRAQVLFVEIVRL